MSKKARSSAAETNVEPQGGVKLRVRCTLPNASVEISGIPFRAINGAMVSEEVPEELAKRFELIPGYELLK